MSADERTPSQLRRILLKSYEEIDTLADTDPLALRDYAYAVSQEVLRLTDTVEFERLAADER